MVGGKCIAMATSYRSTSAQLEDSSTKGQRWRLPGAGGHRALMGRSDRSLVTLEDNGTNGELPQDSR